MSVFTKSGPFRATLDSGVSRILVDYVGDWKMGGSDFEEASAEP